MSKKTIGVVLIVLGVVLLLVSITADTLGIGTGNGFGWKQAVGAIVGNLIALAGIWLSVNKPSMGK
jgi:hypothetical protein